MEQQIVNQQLPSVPIPFLKGRIEITDDLQFVMNIAGENFPWLVIINLDEFNERIKGQGVIRGVELLPPPEAVMAEQEGDNQAYDFILDAYYSQPPIQLFVAGIIASLYKGNNVLLYFPDLNPAESVTIPKLLDLWWMKFGIAMGCMNSPYYPQAKLPVYNVAYKSVWLSLMYTNRIITPYEFIIQYPLDQKINPQEMFMLCTDIRPIDKDPTIGIRRLKERLMQNPNVKPAFYDISGKRGF